MSSARHSNQRHQVRSKGQDEIVASSLYISPPVSSPHERLGTSSTKKKSRTKSNREIMNNTSMQEDTQPHLYLQEKENQSPPRRKRRSDITDQYIVDFNEIDARLVDTLNQPSASTNTNASAGSAPAKKRRKSATPANQHFITDYFRRPAASATTPLSASQPTSQAIKQESIADEGFEQEQGQSQQHDNHSIVSSQGLCQSQQQEHDCIVPPPRTPQKSKPERTPAMAATFQTPERGRSNAVLEVPSSTPGLSPITKASFSAVAMTAAGLRDLSFVSPTPRARWREAAPVVPPFRATRGRARRQSSSGSNVAIRIGSVVPTSVWEDYEEVKIGDGCETGSETDEDYISDEYVPTAANLQKSSLQRDRLVLTGPSQLQPTQGRAREPQFEKELHLSSSSSNNSNRNSISGIEAEDDRMSRHGIKLEPQSDSENGEMIGIKAASESICSTVSSIRSPVPMSDANNDYDYDNEDNNGIFANDDNDNKDSDYDTRSALFLSLEFPCAQRASDSLYSHEESSSDNDEEEDGDNSSGSGRKRAGNSGGKSAGVAAAAEVGANGHHDDNDDIGTSADEEVLRAWAEQRQRVPPALLLLESRYDPVDDRSLAADSEAAAAAAVMVAVAAEDDDLFSLPLQPQLRYRSSQFPSQALSQSQSQSLMRSDSTTATATTGGDGQRRGERYLYSTQRPIDFDNDTESEDESMSDADSDNTRSDKLVDSNLTESHQDQQKEEEQQQEQHQLNRHQQFAMPLSQYQQASQALPVASTQQQHHHQEHQHQQTLINEPSPSTQYYVDRILTTSMLESLPLPELLPSSPAHLQLHQSHNPRHRRRNRK
ncbi:hypothetical protein DV113_004403 [Geotrichum candidum]|uniref:Uncharacterized protein n=1 Tax=Geotrichum candidum TaxID=1173061 RepID=A0A0J9XG69_GEOCN|nr:hypothetical protein DV113_004403 [Geotrichum candidum]KAI9211595.1 hypothetical protein DS838_003537 [Geotrichum bryndzae]CDO56313.1 hypothetical protein, no similarity [Geotrichum candidum]